MQVKNNYDILWREEDGSASGMGMFNGDIGVIQSVDKESVVVDFDGKIVEYTPDMLGELEPAFAVTVHKSQGSEPPSPGPRACLLWWGTRARWPRWWPTTGRPAGTPASGPGWRERSRAKNRCRADARHLFFIQGGHCPLENPQLPGTVPFWRLCIKKRSGRASARPPLLTGCIDSAIDYWMDRASPSTVTVRPSISKS